MGISVQIARLLLREHRYKPIIGNLLCIGKQTVELTVAQALSIIEWSLALSSRRRDRCESDGRAHQRQTKLYHRPCILRALCGCALSCLGQSAYEGANIVFDLCDADLPTQLEGRLDFIYDGSSLDNIFDPAMAIRNLTRVTRPGGRIIHVNRTSRLHGDYVAFSLSWFHDFYSINNFQDCQVYLAQRDLADGWKNWDVYRYLPVIEHEGSLIFFGQDQYFFPWRVGACVVLAEKGVDSTWNAKPIQYQYRAAVPHTIVDGNHETLAQNVLEYAADPYVRAAVRVSRSNRPCWLRPDEKVDLPPEKLHYAPTISYCGSIGPI